MNEQNHITCSFQMRCNDPMKSIQLKRGMTQVHPIIIIIIINKETKAITTYQGKSIYIYL